MFNPGNQNRSRDAAAFPVLEAFRMLNVYITLMLILSQVVFSEDQVVQHHPKLPQQQLPQWQLPMELTKDNTSITFSVDSTWHMIEGKVKAVTGRVWQADPKDNGTIHALVKLSVGDFDTGDISRDKKMRSVMHAAVHPQVIFEMDHISGLCTFEELECVASKECSGAGHGFIEISGARRAIVLEMTVVRKDLVYLVNGHTMVKWSDFGVEDPSILVAYLNETVNIEVEVKIPVRTAQGSKDK